MKKLKIGVIGCGTIFPAHAESIRQSCKDIAYLAAVSDIKQDRLMAAAAKYNCAAYANYRQMIDIEKPDIVHVCTPNYLHKEMSAYAMERGVHVYQEKPMAISAIDALELYTLAKNKKVKYAVSFQTRFSSSTQLAKKSIDSGDIGKIVSAKLNLTLFKPDDYYLKSDWKGTQDKEGGGVVMDQAIESLDILRFLFNSEIEWIDACTANRMHLKIQVEDEASGVIMFKNNSYVNFYVMRHYSYDDDVVMEIHGEKGKIKIVKDSVDVYIKDKFFGGHKSAKLKKSELMNYGPGQKEYHGFCHSIEIRKFYDAVINNTAFDADEEAGLATQWMVEAVYESGRTGKRVIMDELKVKNQI